jgi:hypothetical protein
VQGTKITSLLYLDVCVCVCVVFARWQILRVTEKCVRYARGQMSPSKGGPSPLAPPAQIENVDAITRPGGAEMCDSYLE